MALVSELLWSGEHWIAYQRHPGEESNSASVGIYHTSFSPAGEGNVALVNVPGENGLQVAVTDNLKVYEFTMDRVRAGSADDPFNEVELPLIEGSILRGGDVRVAPYWIIKAENHTVITSWTDIQDPVIVKDLPPNNKGTSVAFSVLMFAETGAITIENVQAPGEPFFREGWRRLTGPDGPASSFCFALAETYTSE